MTADPNGCRHCDVPQRTHYQRWKEPVGWHGWIEPTDDQRLQRMLARRSARAPIMPPLVAARSVQDIVDSLPPGTVVT